MMAPGGEQIITSKSMLSEKSSAVSENDPSDQRSLS